MPSVAVRGVKLVYEVLGAGGPWVAISPGGRRGLALDRPLGVLVAEAGFRVLMYDRRNTGASEIGQPPLRQAGDLFVPSPQASPEALRPLVHRLQDDSRTLSPDEHLVLVLREPAFLRQAFSDFVTPEQMARLAFLRHAHTVRLCSGVGEPTINPHLSEINLYLSRTWPHLALNFFTNGLAAVESSCYGLFAIASMRDPAHFPLKTFKDKKKVNPRSRERGTVIVRFTIDSAGQVLSREIATSSGSKILDDAAVASIDRASPFPPSAFLLPTPDGERLVDWRDGGTGRRAGGAAPLLRRRSRGPRHPARPAPARPSR